MVGDNERREVARRLRKTHVERYNSILNGIHLGEIVGVGAQIVSPHEDQVRAAADRLADLIEPSGHECVPGECPLNVCHDNERIDRDALLALADELDGLGHSGFSIGWSSGAVNVGSFARRIRDALGVE